MSSDQNVTQSFYTGRAATYAADTGDYSISGHLLEFSSCLRAGDRILEIGCGSGRDSAWMLSQGFDVHPTDGVPAMAEQASARLGIPVAVLPFDQISAVEAYDGVWANACLLHVPREQLPDVLRRIHQAARPGGLFYASYKAGTAEGVDQFDRYYNYPDETWLAAAYGNGWSSLKIVAEDGGGYDGKPTAWLHVFARKSDPSEA